MFLGIYVPVARYYRWIMDNVEKTGVAAYEEDYVDDQ